MHLPLIPRGAIQLIQEPPRIVAFQKTPLEKTPVELVKCLENKKARLYEHDLLNKYGIVVFMPYQDQTTTPRSMLDSCSEPKSEWLEIPVVQDHETYQVPTNEIFIKFKSGNEAAPIEGLRQKYRFFVSQTPTRRNPNRFTVSLEGAAAAKSTAVAADIAKLPTVEYAEVNFVVITYPLEVIMGAH